MVNRQPMIDWIDAQIAQNGELMRTACPHGEEEYPERSVYAQDMRMLVRIRDALQEVSAVEYLEARREMCDAHDTCKGCPLDDHCIPIDERDDFVRAVKAVKEWKEEHL